MLGLTSKCTSSIFSDSTSISKKNFSKRKVRGFTHPSTWLVYRLKKRRNPFSLTEKTQIQSKKAWLNFSHHWSKMKFSLLIFPAHQTSFIYFLEKSQFPFFSISKHDLNITTNIIVRPQFQVFEKHHRHSCLSEECHDGKNSNKKKKKMTRRKLILWLSSQFTFQKKNF